MARRIRYCGNDAAEATPRPDAAPAPLDVTIPLSEMQKVITRLRKVYSRVESRHVRESLRILQTYVDDDSRS